MAASLEHGFSPYIGENGNWYVYDQTNEGFIDTGIAGVVDSSIIPSNLHIYSGDYEQLLNKPSINGVELVGNKNLNELNSVSKEYKFIIDTTEKIFNISSNFRGILTFLDSDPERCGMYIIVSTSESTVRKTNILEQTGISISLGTGTLSMQALSSGSIFAWFQVLQGTVTKVEE